MRITALLRITIAGSLIALFGWAADLTSAPNVDPKTYQAHINYLASDALKGRATGSPEIELAAKYIQKQFASFGLKPVPGTNSYYQEFTAPTGASLTAGNRMTVTRDGHTEPLAINSGFIPFSFSSTGPTVDTPVVFAGYGITAPEYHYDDYAGIDVQDKFVLILADEPQENDPKSLLTGRINTTYATDINKAINAKNHGARGVILASDAPHHPGRRDELKFGLADGPNDSGTYFVQIHARTADQWLASSGHSLQKVVSAIDHDLKPESFTLPGITAALTINIVHEQKPARNVVAYLPGKTDEYIVIGAHYDHLGLGGRYSLAPSQTGQVHHGADDNASGTAGVIELARYFSKQPQQQRGILFMTFAGEEMGLLGSEYFVNHPLLPLGKSVAMLNMDMIGRIRQGQLIVNGAESGSTLPAIIAATPAPGGLKVESSKAREIGGSDHESFLAKQIPALFFFSGLHEDYHKPSDTADKINSAGAAQVVDYVADIATQLLAAPGRPAFQKVAVPKADPHSPGTPVTSGYGPLFGSVPDFEELPNGVRFADIQPGTPADKAGLRAGDILISFGDKKIGNLYEFTYALQSHKAGDEVLVRVIRGNQTIEAKVLLEQRR